MTDRPDQAHEIQARPLVYCSHCKTGPLTSYTVIVGRDPEQPATGPVCSLCAQSVRRSGYLPFLILPPTSPVFPLTTGPCPMCGAAQHTCKPTNRPNR